VGEGEKRTTDERGWRMEDGGWRSNDEEWRIRKAGRQEGRKAGRRGWRGWVA
jgi:hypothetical protein